MSGDWTEWSKFVLKSIERIEEVIENLKRTSDKAVYKIYEKIGLERKEVDAELKQIKNDFKDFENRVDHRIDRFEDKIDKFDDELSKKGDKVEENRYNIGMQSVKFKTFKTVGFLLLTVLINFLFNVLFKQIF